MDTQLSKSILAVVRRKFIIKAGKPAALKTVVLEVP
jgi:hypothetical protein